MKYKLGLGCVAVLLLTVACETVDSGPTETATDRIDAGNAEAVRAEIHMGAGNLQIEDGGISLMDSNFRYSEKLGRPVVRYDVTGAHGQLTVESPNGGSSGGHNTVNEWDLHMGSKVPLDMKVSLGAGESKLDMSRLLLRSVEVDIGAGEMSLNVAGHYTRDVTVQVNGGVGEARIKLPKDMGAVVDATGGIGSISANGLTKRDGKYYNDAYAEGKPAIRMTVRGGVGDVVLSLAE